MEIFLVGVLSLCRTLINKIRPCQLEFKDPTGNITPIPVNIIAGTNNFTASVQELQRETNYVVNIKEIESGASNGIFSGLYKRSRW